MRDWKSEIPEPTYKRLRSVATLFGMESLADYLSMDVQVLLLTKFDGNDEITKFYCKQIVPEMSDEEIKSLSGSDLLDMHQAFFLKFLDRSGFMKSLEKRLESMRSEWIRSLKEVVQSQSQATADSTESIERGKDFGEV